MLYNVPVGDVGGGGEHGPVDAEGAHEDHALELVALGLPLPGQRLRLRLLHAVPILPRANALLEGGDDALEVRQCLCSGGARPFLAPDLGRTIIGANRSCPGAHSTPTFHCIAITKPFPYNLPAWTLVNAGSYGEMHECIFKHSLDFVDKTDGSLPTSSHQAGKLYGKGFMKAMQWKVGVERAPAQDLLAPIDL
eukprot:9481755-Pyramimonas_sp.AAC.1